MTPSITDLASIEAEVSTYGRGSVPRELRRRQVLAIALELVSEVGYQEMAMDEVARRCGVSKPVIYETVGSKAELFGTLLDVVNADLAASMIDAVRRAGQHTDRIYASTLALFTWVDQHREVWMHLLGARDVPVSASVADIRTLLGGVLSALLEESFPELTVEMRSSSAHDGIFLAISQAALGVSENLASWWVGSDGLDVEAITDLAVGLIGPGLMTTIQQLHDTFGVPFSSVAPPPAAPSALPSELTSTI